VRALITISSLLLVLAGGCGDKPQAAGSEQARPVTATAEAEPTPEPANALEPAPGVYAEVANTEGAYARTLCIAGPGSLADDPNGDLSELCRRAPGVVRRCDPQAPVCSSAWPLDEWQQGLEALISSLDKDDAGCRITFVGWSRGGAIAAEELPKALREDPRITPMQAMVERLVVIAPWAPEREHIEIPANVRNAWIYRYTKAPETDCSRAFEGGPWLSPPPVCAASTNCWDYDYSLEPQLAFLSRRGARGIAAIDHCEIISVVAKLGMDNITFGIEAPSEHLPHYSNGEHGGRKDLHAD
jgi:hypothetical protein